MADANRPAPALSRTTRVGGLAVVVFASISLALSLLGSWTTGDLRWRGPVTSIGIGLLGLAFVLGPHPRGRYYSLLGISLTLAVLSLGFGMLGWW